MTITLDSGSKIEQAIGRGVTISVSKKLEKQYGPAVLSLASQLKADGIDVKAEYLSDDDPSPDNVHIFVGSKL